MRRFATFLGVTGVFLALWLVIAMAFDLLVAQISYDYIPAARASSRYFWAQGLFLACLLAASSTVSARRKVSGVRTILAGAGLLPLITGLAVTSAGVGYFLLFSFGFIDDSNWRLAFPRRHALYVGMDRGFTVGVWLSYLTLCVLTWRARAATSPSGETSSQPQTEDFSGQSEAWR